MMATRSRRAPGSPPDKCTCSTPSAAASLNTRAQVCGIEFVAAPIERERIGAIGTAERTAVRQLGEKPKRLVERGAASCCAVPCRTALCAVSCHLAFSLPVAAGLRSAVPAVQKSPCRPGSYWRAHPAQGRPRGRVVTIPGAACRRGRAAAPSRRRARVRAAPNRSWPARRRSRRMSLRRCSV